LLPTPPRSTLFPYTTLFRSFGLDGPQATDAGAAHRAAARLIGLGEIDPGVPDGLHSGAHAVLHELVHAAGFLGRDVLADVEIARSDEHTSELQSLAHLVLRL